MNGTTIRPGAHATPAPARRILRCTMAALALAFAAAAAAAPDDSVVPLNARFLVAVRDVDLPAIDRALQQWQVGTDLTFAIVDKTTGEFLGSCGLHGGSNPRRPEFGIWLKISAHGRALGREAIGTLHAWSVEHLAVDAFIYPVDRRNLSSRKIAEHLGGISVGERQVRSLNGIDLELVVYSLPCSIDPSL